ncbi:AsmA family protein [Rhizobium sp. CFBP 8762]|uniref:AsmA family protein n=1 Tax=Rhizobium sp. CFBP 8762 TaxID=2775279 RepID=UPI00177C6D4A|nr:AsmA family protein [Rhizobium sp. CFBP 8762]
MISTFKQFKEKCEAVFRLTLRKNRKLPLLHRIRDSKALRSRRLGIGVVAGVLAVFGCQLALPLLLPTGNFKSQMEEALSTWSGGTATIFGDPDIRFWPTAEVTLRGIRIQNAARNTTLADIDAITADFSVLSSFWGKPNFDDFQMQRPLVNVERAADGTWNWPPAGWLSSLSDIAGTRRLGDVTFTDGSVSVIDRVTQQRYHVSDITGTLNWPDLARQLDINLTAVMNGEKVSWAFASNTPLALLKGQNAAVSTSLVSAPLTVTFDGNANIASNAFASGALRLGAPSLPALLTWYGSDISALSNLGQINAQANISTVGNTVKLDNLNLAVQNARATGVLDIRLPQAAKRPQVSGTLAFDEIDLKSFLSAFSPLPSTADDLATTVDMNFIRQLALDLRLSATRARFGDFLMTDLAAGMMVEDGRASFDIGDSTFADGSLTGRLAVSDQGFKGGGSLQLSIKNAELGSIADTLKRSGPVLTGRGDINISLGTRKPLWATQNSDISGHMSVAANAGALTGVDVNALETMISVGNFFPLTDASQSTFSFDTADIDVQVSDGLAKIERANILAPGKALRLWGVVPYETKSLALSGTLETLEGTAITAASYFFVGGTWPDAIISPASTLGKAITTED